MSSPDPTAPPGWYDDAKLLGIKRYWDGAAWTERTAPAGEVRGDLDKLDHRSGLDHREGRDHRFFRVWQVVAVIAVFVAIAAMVFALTRPTALPIAQPSATAEPSASAITIPPGDYTAFIESTTRDLDDFDKDLDDFEATVDDGGYWRLLSNTAELRFNLEQLRGTAAPTFLAAEWDDALDDLDDALQDLADTIEGSQKSQRAALGEIRDVSADARELVELLEN